MHKNHGQLVFAHTGTVYCVQYNSCESNPIPPYLSVLILPTWLTSRGKRLNCLVLRMPALGRHFTACRLCLKLAVTLWGRLLASRNILYIYLPFWKSLNHFKIVKYRSSVFVEPVHFHRIRIRPPKKNQIWKRLETFSFSKILKRNCNDKHMLKIIAVKMVNKKLLLCKVFSKLSGGRIRNYGLDPARSGSRCTTLCSIQYLGRFY
jgi:hypothetical protein